MEATSQRSLESAVQAVLQRIALDTRSDRSYVFNFHGQKMSNTFEYTVGDTAPFQEHLQQMKCNELPYFVRRLKKNKPVVVREAEDVQLNRKAQKEAREMELEKIQNLALMPVTYHAGKTIAGFIGLDVCHEARRDWDENTLQHLLQAGQLLFTLQALHELSTGEPPRWMTERQRRAFVSERRSVYKHHDRQLELVEAMRRHDFFHLCAPHALSLVRETAPVPRLRLRANATPNNAHVTICPTQTQQQAQEHFREHRYALLPPEVWESGGVDHDDMEDLRQALLDCLHCMEPDIEPYTRFRNVGYARFLYRYGSLLSLKHKQFFQVDPKANVLLNAKPRPFSRLSDQARDHPALRHLLLVLLEQVWNCDLGPEVHIAVHPVQVRNFHEGEIHKQAHATLEGTHVDSTHRVAVVLLDRVNVHPETARTSLYRESCPIGLRRDLPEHEEILAPLRVESVILMRPFQAITFDDTKFKHDASDPHPLDPTKRMSRCVLLIMCRLPCTQDSPLSSPDDPHPIDGYTPRTPRVDRDVVPE